MAHVSASQPGISVVIPVKDRADLLAQTLRSVRDQTRRVDEIVVVDDGSSDDSAAVARDHDATVIDTGPESRGPSVARNLGLARISTEYICLLDSDDLLRPRAIEKLTDALEATPSAPFAFGEALEAERTNDDWRPQGIIAPLAGEVEGLPGALYVRNFVPASSPVVRTAAIRDIGGYPSWLEFNEDHYTWIQLARLGAPVYVPELLTIIRKHGGGRHEALAHDAVAALTSLADEDPRLAARRPERFGVQLLNMASSALRRRQVGEAAVAVRDLLLRQPDRGRILHAAAHRWRTRRLLTVKAGEVWRTDRELRAFLSSYT